MAEGCPPGHPSDSETGDPDGDRGSISELIFLTTAEPVAVTRGSSGRLVTTGRLGVPEQFWEAIRARCAAGASLRLLAREYDVSQECIRRVLAGAAHAAEQAATA
jgi:hypothetical protein